MIIVTDTGKDTSYALLNQTNYLWLGCKHGDPLLNLGNIVAKHSKGNADGVKLKRQGLQL